MKEIPLTQGRVALVDDEDFESLSGYRWHFSAVGYAYTAATKMYLHRLLLGATHGEYVDHINGDRLDNRRENLRIVTKQQNLQNRGINKKSTSGFKGVSRARKMWRSYIKIKRKQISLGHYATPQEAARAYNEAAVKYFGAFARLNEGV